LVEDDTNAEAIGRVLSQHMQLCVVETQAEIVPIKTKYPGVSILALQTVQTRWAQEKLMIRDGKEDKIKLPTLPEGAHYAVNLIHLTRDQMQLNLRQRLWYFLLGSSIVFDKASVMNAYVDKNGVSATMIAVDNMELIKASGIQCGGESRPPLARFGASPFEERAECIKMTEELETIREKISSLGKQRAATETMEQEFLELQGEIAEAESSLNGLQTSAVDQEETERRIAELQGRMDELQGGRHEGVLDPEEPKVKRRKR